MDLWAYQNRVWIDFRRPGSQLTMHGNLQESATSRLREYALIRDAGGAQLGHQGLPERR